MLLECSIRIYPIRSDSHELISEAPVWTIPDLSPPMDVSNWFERETWQLEPAEWTVVAATSVVITLALTTAWSTGGAALVFVLTPTLLLALGGRRIGPVRPPTVLIGLAIAWIYAAVSMLWAADLVWSLRALALVAALFGGLYLSACLNAVMPHRWLEHMTRTILVCFVLFLVYGLIEETFDHPIKRALFWPFQAMRFVDGAFVIDWEHVSRVRAYRTNWNMTTSSLLLWPVLLIARSHLERRDYNWLAPLMVAAVIAMVLQSQHGTAAIAIVLAVIAYVLAGVSSRAMSALATLGWLAAIVLVVPASQMAFERQVHLNPSLEVSARHRIVLWSYTADRITERPIFGVGVGSTAPLDAKRGNDLPTIPGTRIQIRTGHHPHNIILQIWYEFGAIGAIILLAIGWHIIWRMQRLSEPERSAYMAAFVTSVATSMTGFGLFEVWYTSALALCASVLWLASRYHELNQTEAGDL